MPHRYLFHAVADPDVYESPWRWGDSADCLPPPQLLPGDWRREDQGPWSVFSPPGDVLPPQGWKVHISATPDAAATTVKQVARHCTQLGITFKVLRSRRLVHMTQLKYADRRASGKVATCYPHNAHDLEHLVLALAQVLRGAPGSRVLGDVPVAGAPVSLRYGAFTPMWVLDDRGRRVPALWRDGRLVPDQRGIPTVGEGPTPEFVAQLQRQAAQYDSAHVLDITNVSLLHRSNAGGVYRAQRPDGRLVVLKEARRHTGFDPSGTEATVRLRHEHVVLERLDGSGVSPRPIALHDLGDSIMLEMEYLPGETLARTIARRHPTIDPSVDPRGTLGYLTDTDGVLAAARGALETAHRLGVTHGDVQPANILIAERGIHLIDWESATLDGHRPSPAVATPGYFDPDLTGEQADTFGLQRCRLTALNPLTPLLEHRPDIEGDLIHTALRDLRDKTGGDLPADWVEPWGASRDPAPTAPGGAQRQIERLLDGIESSATPHRHDRLFPGDIAQFSGPGGGLGLLYGAAGVIQTLALHGRDTGDHLTWLQQHAARHELGASLDGGLGIALCLAAGGRGAAAADLARRCMPGRHVPAPDTPWWQDGLAGRVVALARLGVDHHDAQLIDLAVDGARQLETLIRQPSANPPSYRAGLQHGWAGVACALLATGDLLGPDHAWMLEAAQDAVMKELPALAPHGGVLLSRDGGKAMPYLGEGSAATGWAAQALLERLDADHPAGPRLQSLVGAVLATCSQKVIAAGGLLEGRAGLLAVLDRLSSVTAPMITEHRRRMSWYLVHATPEHPRSWGEGSLALGRMNLRCSADLATGAAGIVLALGDDPADKVAALLELPTTPVAETPLMTPVTRDS